MPRTELPELALEFHEPDTAIFEAAVNNLEWERSNVRGSLAYSAGTSRASLSTRERRMTAILDDFQRDRKLLTDWRIRLRSHVDAVEVEPLYTGSGIAIPPIIGELMKRYSFYYLYLVASCSSPRAPRPRSFGLPWPFKPIQTQTATRQLCSISSRRLNGASGRKPPSHLALRPSLGSTFR